MKIYNSQKQSGRPIKLNKCTKPHLILKGCICNTKPTSAPRFFPHSLQFLQFLELTNNISPAISAKSLAVKPVARTQIRKKTLHTNRRFLPTKSKSINNEGCKHYK